MEQLQAQPAPDELPDLNDGADTDNEFVKQYLEQRQKLFEAQREATRKQREGMLIFSADTQLYFSWWFALFCVSKSVELTLPCYW